MTSRSHLSLEVLVMRILFRHGFALGGLVLLTSMALVMAQGFRGFGGGGGGNLLKNQSVQKELKLTDDQIAKIEAVVKQVDDKFKEKRDTTKKIEDKQQRFEKFGELQKKISSEILKDLSDVLKPDQSKRLKQIQLQLRQSMVFQDP